MSGILSNIVLSGAGAAFLLFIVARIIPNEKLWKWGIVAGQVVSAFGAGKLGSVFWEKIEDFMENSSAVFLAGVKAGLDADDPKPDEKRGDTRKE